MLQGEALRRGGERSSPLQVCFDFPTSLFGTRLACWRSRPRGRGLFYKDCFGETPKLTRETHVLPGTGKDAQSLSNEL